MKRGTRYLLALVGLLLFGWLVLRVGPRELAEDVRQLGWGLALVLLLGGLTHAVRTWAWRLTLFREQRTLSFWRMFGIRLAGEAVSQLTFAGQLVGETTRVWMVRGAMPAVAGVSSIILDRVLFMLTALMLAVAGTVYALAALPLPGRLQQYNGIVALIFAGLIALAAAAVQKRWAVLSGCLELAGRIPSLQGWVAHRRPAVREVENSLYGFYQGSPTRFWASLGANVLGHLVTMMEVYVVLRYLDTGAGMGAALAIEALTKVINTAGFIVPGNFGTSEGLTMLLLAAMGLGSSTGLTLAVTRRLRGLFWTIAGMSVLYSHGFRAGSSGGESPRLERRARRE